MKMEEEEEEEEMQTGEIKHTTSKYIYEKSWERKDLELNL